MGFSKADWLRKVGFEKSPSKNMQAITLMVVLSQEEIEQQQNIRCLKRLIKKRLIKCLELEANVSEC